MFNYQLILQGAGVNGEDIRVWFDAVDITHNQETGVSYIFNEDELYEVQTSQIVILPVMAVKEAV